MPYFDLRLSSEYAPLNLVAKTLSRSTLSMENCVYCGSDTLSWSYQDSIFQRKSPKLVCVTFSTHLRNCAKVRGTNSIFEYCPPRVNLSSFEKNPLDDVGSSTDSDASFGNENFMEEQRRRKIGLANRGRVPWNKGRKHTEETRVRIKQRTIEALRDPKVRKKMSEHPKLHSDQTKEKIKSSLRRVWNKRFKWKQLREKFIASWSESIAVAAKKGGSDQQELDWDSYDKLKQEIAQEQIRWTAQKEKANELARLRAEKRALAKAEKMERLAQRRKEREEKAKAIKERTDEDLQRQNRSMAIALEMKLRRRLTKIHKKKPTHGPDAATRSGWHRVISIIPNSGKLDIEFIKKERMRREISLADQIQAAKSRRADSITEQASAS